jgi:hypothetical protein
MVLVAATPTRQSHRLRAVVKGKDMESGGDLHAAAKKQAVWKTRLMSGPVSLSVTDAWTIIYGQVQLIKGDVAPTTPTTP